MTVSGGQKMATSKSETILTVQSPHYLRLKLVEIQFLSLSNLLLTAVKSLCSKEI